MCCGIFKPKISFSTGERKPSEQLKKWFCLKNKPNQTKTQTTSYTYSLSVLSFSSHLNMPRAKALPIPMCHPTPLLQTRNAQTNSFVCRLHTQVWALGGCEAMWRTPAASVFHALHSLSHSQGFFALLDLPNLLSKPRQTNTFPSNFCKIFTYYFSISCFSSSKSPLRALEKQELFHINYHMKDTSFRTLNITNLTIAATCHKPWRSRMCSIKRVARHLVTRPCVIN